MPAVDKRSTDPFNLALHYTLYYCLTRSYLLKRAVACCAADFGEIKFVYTGADSMGLGGHVSPLLQLAGHGGTVSRKTANKKPTKLY